FLELPGEIVVCGGVARIELEGATQAELRVARLAGGLLRQRQVHVGGAALRIELQRLVRLRRRRVEATERVERRRQVDARRDVPRLDGDDALELARRLVGEPPAEIEVPEVVVRLDVHLVALQRRAVVHQRLLEVAGALVVEPELEVVRLARRSFSDGGRSRSEVRGPKSEVRG